MKHAMTSKEAIEIYGSMDIRMKELWDKLISGNYNDATQFTFEIGFIADIDDCLKKLKIKRTPVEHKNVSELEIEDIEKHLREL